MSEKDKSLTWLVIAVVTVCYLIFLGEVYFIFTPSGDVIGFQSGSEHAFGIAALLSFVYVLFVLGLIKFIRITK